MDRIRTLVVDDEPLARRTLRQLLEKDEGIELVGESYGRGAVEEIEAARPDLVLLDIQMPGMDGFEVLSALTLRPLPMVIFVTAFEAHAVRAFELRALDYVLKPFSDRRLLEALARAKERFRREETAGAQRRLLALLADRAQRTEESGASGPGALVGRGRLERLIIRDGGRTLLLDPGDVEWIEADGVYARVHLHGRKPLLVRASLSSLQDELDPGRFFRIHRSAIVNVGFVRELSHLSHGDYVVVLRDGTELKLSRTRRAEFESWLGLGD